MTCPIFILSSLSSFVTGQNITLEDLIWAGIFGALSGMKIDILDFFVAIYSGWWEFHTSYTNGDLFVSSALSGIVTAAGTYCNFDTYMKLGKFELDNFTKNIVDIVFGVPTNLFVSTTNVIIEKTSNNNSAQAEGKTISNSYEKAKEYRHGNSTIMRGPYRLSASYVV